MPRASVILAAGGVVCRDGEVILVRRPRHCDWTFPKGKLKKGESFQEAAVREVAEETGYRVRLEQFLGAIGYEVEGVPKVVLYWRMSVVREEGIPDEDEIAEVAWLPREEALSRLGYEKEKDLLEILCASFSVPI